MNSRNGMEPYGLTLRETRLLRSLSPPHRLQAFLDNLDYDVGASAHRSPRRVIIERRVQCAESAMFAAAALRLQGFPPLIVDLEAVRDTDHVVAVFRYRGLWGAVGRSNYAGLRFREPVFPTLRALVLSYFEHYSNGRREKTLRRYSQPFNLSRFDTQEWMTTEESLLFIMEHLVETRHYRLIPKWAEKRLGPVDRRLFKAGFVGKV